MNSHQTWVLAFDAACVTCRQLTRIVARECGDKLAVRPLDDEEVARWRVEAFGANPPWMPTLIRIGDGRVRAWTGPGAAIQLIWRLGPRAAVRLLRTLGELRSAGNEPARAGEGTTRKDFLRFGAGAAMATALVVFGKTPAFADPVQRIERARVWVRANLANLPRDYGRFVTYDLTYRKVIYEALAPGDRARLWSEHLRLKSATLPELSSQQAEVIERAMALARDERTFTSGRSDKHHRSLDELREAAITAFGLDRARSLLAILGPTPIETLGATCECSTESDYCTIVCIYDGRGRCAHWPDGCGTFWLYPCNGCCSYCSYGCC